jgi:hypothetical protein
MFSRIGEWLIMREIRKREKEGEKRFIRNAISTIEEILAEAYRRARWERPRHKLPIHTILEAV